MNQMEYYERMAKAQMRTALNELRNDAPVSSWQPPPPGYMWVQGPQSL